MPPSAGACAHGQRCPILLCPLPCALQATPCAEAGITPETQQQQGAALASCPASAATNCTCASHLPCITALWQVRGYGELALGASRKCCTCQPTATAFTCQSASVLTTASTTTGVQLGKSCAKFISADQNFAHPDDAFW